MPAQITTALLLSKNKLFVINSFKHHFQILCFPQMFPLHAFPDCLCLDTNIFIWREALLSRHISLPLPLIHKSLSSGQEHLTFPHFIFAWLSAELSLYCLLGSVWNYLALSISLHKDSAQIPVALRWFSGKQKNPNQSVWAMSPVSYSVYNLFWVRAVPLADGAAMLSDLSSECSGPCPSSPPAPFAIQLPVVFLSPNSHFSDSHLQPLCVRD